MAPFHRLAAPALVAAVLAGCAMPGQRLADQPAPAVEGMTADGSSMRLADHAGKVVLLSFWHGH